jgi:hypothetical protein
MIQPFIARTAEGTSEIRVLQRGGVVFRRLQNVGFDAAANVARHGLEKAIRHAG